MKNKFWEKFFSFLMITLASIMIILFIIIFFNYIFKFVSKKIELQLLFIVMFIAIIFSILLLIYSFSQNENDQIYNKYTIIEKSYLKQLENTIKLQEEKILFLKRKLK